MKQEETDAKRSNYFNQLIVKFCNLLTLKLQLGIKYRDMFEGNFSLDPYF